jgi:hypothetical protein
MSLSTRLGHILLSPPPKQLVRDSNTTVKWCNPLKKNSIKEA